MMNTQTAPLAPKSKPMIPPSDSAMDWQMQRPSASHVPESPGPAGAISSHDSPTVKFFGQPPDSSGSLGLGERSYVWLRRRINPSR